MADFPHRSLSPASLALWHKRAIPLPFPTRRATHMAVLIQLVVGEFDFFEGHHLLQQLLSRERGVRVHVQPKEDTEKACS